MSKKQMQIDALDSMNNGSPGYFWDNDLSIIGTGSVYTIFPFNFVNNPQRKHWQNFSFTDPRHREALPKDTLVMIKHVNIDGWLPYISTGKFNNSGNLIVKSNSIDNELAEFEVITEWRLPENGKVPEDLR